MKWIFYLVILLILVAGVTFLVGYALPAITTVSRSITLQQSPEVAFAVLADLPGLAGWNRNTEKIEMLPPVNGIEASKQTFKGGMTMTIVTAESVPPHRLVRVMGDDGGPFVGCGLTKSLLPGPERRSSSPKWPNSRTHSSVL